MLAYSARVLEDVDNGPGYWESQRIGVFRGEGEDAQQIGEYTRDYSNFYNTFCPFQQDGKDYALYSPQYTVTRLMELPSCRDIGGEEPSSYGFCPVDFYVPFHAERSQGSRMGRVNHPTPEQLAKPDMGPVTYYPFGFVAGCLWGDDSGWKIQYLDLSDAAKGIIRRDERFGYIAIGGKERLRDAISMYAYGTLEDDETYHIQITATQTFDLRNGERVHPFSYGTEA